MRSPPVRAGLRLVGVASGSGTGGPMGAERGRQIMDEGAMDFSMEELREFLEGDRLDVRADPAFKERLRRKLWDMVQQRLGRPPESTS